MSSTGEPSGPGTQNTGPLPSRGLLLTGVFATVILVGLGIGWLARQEPVERAELGKTAPSFTVDLLDGGSFDLEEHLSTTDETLVLNLWASWCAPCRAEIPEISAFAVANPGTKVLGVAVEDTLEAAKSFAEELSPSYPLGFGDPEFDEAYPRIGLPVTYVIDANGIVTAVFNGILDEDTLADLVSG